MSEFSGLLLIALVAALLVLPPAAYLRRRIQPSTQSMPHGQIKPSGNASENGTASALTAQSLQILSRAIEQSQSGIVIADCYGVIEYVNPRYSRITGYGLQEAIGQITDLINNQELTDGNQLTLQEAMQLGSSWETFMSSHRKNGESFWQQVTASPILDDDGALTHIVLNIDDISERIETQEALMLAQEPGLLFGFHTFGNNLQTQPLGHGDNGSGDGNVFRVVRQVGDKGAINLELVDRESGQVVQ